MKVFQNIHEAYLKTVADVIDNPDYICAPRGQLIREKVDYSFRVLNPVAEPIVTHDLERNITIAEYTQKEFDWYMSGDCSVEAAAKCSSFWGKIANPDGKVQSNYGFLVFDLKDHGNTLFDPKMRSPWEWAKQALMHDKDTRQAIVRFSRPEHFFQGVKDFPCTTHGIFQIRENKLNFSVVMRAND
jgi:thymidylate synthase